MHELTNEEREELCHFKVRQRDCAHQVILAVMASDYMDRERFQHELLYQDFYETFLEKGDYCYDTYWLPDLFVEWLQKLQGKEGKQASHKTAGIALGILDAFYNCSSGACGKAKREIDHAFHEIYEDYLSKTGKYFYDDAEFAYCVALTFLDSVGISREPKKLDSVIDVSNILTDQFQS